MRGLAALVATGLLALPASAAVVVNNNAGATGASMYTQSSASTLAFGTTVMVIYNDSGSFAGAGNQLTGYSRSTDGGNTFADVGRLPTNPLGDAGSAHLARDNTSGAVYTTALSFAGGGLQVFRSSDGGATFAAPVNAAPGVTAANKNAIAVDNAAGAGNGTVYVATEDFGAGGGLRLFKSTDGGATFGGGVLIASGTSVGLAPSITVGPDHRVAVAYVDRGGATPVIRVRSSADGGSTFSAPAVAAALGAPTGDLGLVGLRQGTTTAAGFRALTEPQIAVNPATGQLYVAYADNPAGADKADVFLRSSDDGGLSWGAAQRINTDAGSNDQWQPTIAVTPDGKHLGVFWYDRRIDATNNRIEYYARQCDIAAAALSCLADFALSDDPFLPEFGRDPLVLSTYMGDYDNASADDGFFNVSWGGNPDDLLGGAGRKDPSVYFSRIAVIESGIPPGVPEPGTAALLVAALIGMSGAGAARARVRVRPARSGRSGRLSSIVRRRWCSFGIAMLAVAAPLAPAAALPAASVGADGIFNKGDVIGIHVREFGAFDHASPLLDGALHFESAGTPGPSIRATAEVGPTAVPLANGFINGTLRYTVLITNGHPSERVPVPVLIDASGHAGGFANAGAAFQVKAFWALRNTSNFDLVSNTVEAFVESGSFDQSFGQTHALTLETNAEYVVVMSVDSRAFAFTPGSHAFAETFVDPIFRFAPGVDESLFAFEFSAGIGNSPAVAEPSTSALLALGLAALAASARRWRGRQL